MKADWYLELQPVTERYLLPCSNVECLVLAKSDFDELAAAFHPTVRAHFDSERIRLKEEAHRDMAESDESGELSDASVTSGLEGTSLARASSQGSLPHNKEGRLTRSDKAEEGKSAIILIEPARACD